MRFGERVERSRHDQAANLKAERERTNTLLAPDGDTAVTDVEAQAGRRLHRSELVRRITKLNCNLWYEQSVRYPEQGGVYIADYASPYGKRMVCSMPHEMVNEFSVPLTVPRLVPSASLEPVWDTLQEIDSKIPGWRTVLLKLMQEGLLSPSAIENEFHITEGRSSQKWQQAHA